jgi:hypothetical protein
LVDTSGVLDDAVSHGGAQFWGGADKTQDEVRPGAAISGIRELESVGAKVRVARCEGVANAFAGVRSAVDDDSPDPIDGAGGMGDVEEDSVVCAHGVCVGVREEACAVLVGTDVLAVTVGIGAVGTRTEDYDEGHQGGGNRIQANGYLR